jgi:hypothetical protein
MLRMVFWKEKIEREDFFFPKACLTSILQKLSHREAKMRFGLLSALMLAIGGLAILIPSLLHFG